MPQFLGSSTPINAGLTYTSRWVNTDLSTTISGTVFADQAGNLFIDHSGDGVHVDATTTVAVTASTGTTFSVALVGSYVRVRFTNTAGSNQTIFRLNPKYTLGEMP